MSTRTLLVVLALMGVIGVSVASFFNTSGGLKGDAPVLEPNRTGAPSDSNLPALEHGKSRGTSELVRVESEPKSGESDNPAIGEWWNSEELLSIYYSQFSRALMAATGTPVRDGRELESLRELHVSFLLSAQSGLASSAWAELGELDDSSAKAVKKMLDRAEREESLDRPDSGAGLFEREPLAVSPTRALRHIVGADVSLELGQRKELEAMYLRAVGDRARLDWEWRRTRLAESRARSSEAGKREPFPSDSDLFPHEYLVARDLVQSRNNAYHEALIEFATRIGAFADSVERD